MITDHELNALIEGSLANLYHMMASTEGSPLDHVGEVYLSESGVKLVVIGYSDMFNMEGQPNGTQSPVLTRFYIVRQVNQDTNELRTDDYLLPLQAFTKYQDVDETWPVPNPVVVLPSFKVRRSVRTTPQGELDETSFFSTP